MWLQVHTIPGTKALVSSPQKLGILAPWFPTNNSSYQSKIHSLVKMDASSVTAKMLKQYDTWKGKNRTQQICRKCGLQKAPLTKLLAPTKKSVSSNFTMSTFSLPKYISDLAVFVRMCLLGHLKFLCFFLKITEQYLVITKIIYIPNRDIQTSSILLNPIYVLGFWVDTMVLLHS